MSVVTTTAIFTTKSGTNWTLDVSLLQLSEILPLKDFTVIDVANQIILNNALITKTSATVISYSGPDIGTNVALEVRRNTPISSRYYPIPHGAYINSQALNEELDRILKKLNEIEGFPGAVLGSYILSQPFGAPWATDDITTRTAKNIYEEMILRATIVQLNSEIAALNASLTATINAVNASLNASITTTNNNVTALSNSTTASLALKANIASPALTGTPTTPSPTANNDSQQVAPTIWVNDQLEKSGWRLVQVNTTTGAENQMDLVCSTYTAAEVDQVRYRISNFKGGSTTIGRIGLLRINNLGADTGASSWFNHGLLINGVAASIAYAGFPALSTNGFLYNSNSEYSEADIEGTIKTYGTNRMLVEVKEQRIVFLNPGYGAQTISWNASSTGVYSNAITQLRLFSVINNNGVLGAQTVWPSGVKIEWYIKTKN